ncbi:MAG: PTS sugar transporter subunit IIA [Erysipelothrix sp.]|jgi:PTS system ascorbate-specific IIA component|nr:PTS sugar transporter subunit IIA [Erysipelothrix sp.]
MLRKENVTINHQPTNPIDALRAIGDVLLTSGSITPQYIENMVQSYLDLGPYFVIAPGIAIAHAKPDDSVLRNDIALMVCPQKIHFNSHNDPVSLIFGLCATSGHGHMDGLMALSELLSDEVTTKLISKANDIESIMKLIQPYKQGENV